MPESSPQTLELTALGRSGTSGTVRRVQGRGRGRLVDRDGDVDPELLGERLFAPELLENLVRVVPALRERPRSRPEAARDRFLVGDDVLDRVDVLPPAPLHRRVEERRQVAERDLDLAGERRDREPALVPAEELALADERLDAHEEVPLGHRPLPNAGERHALEVVRERDVRGAEPARDLLQHPLAEWEERRT